MAGEGLDQNSYFLELWRDCQGSKSNCNECIVPSNLCEKWNNESLEEEGDFGLSQK